MSKIFYRYNYNKFTNYKVTQSYKFPSSLECSYSN